MGCSGLAVAFNVGIGYIGYKNLCKEVSLYQSPAPRSVRPSVRFSLQSTYETLQFNKLINW